MKKILNIYVKNELLIIILQKKESEVNLLRYRR